MVTLLQTLPSLSLLPTLERVLLRAVLSLLEEREAQAQARNVIELAEVCHTGQVA